MSRAYRIRVSETLRKVIRAEDGVSTQLEILALLPPEDMAALLKAELLERGFTEDGDKLTRTDDGIVISVDAETGTVSVQAAECEQLELKGDRESRTYNPKDKEAKKALAKNLKEDLENEANEKQAQLQDELTNRLEEQLRDLKKELDQIAKEVTAAALKKKAAQMGQIKEISEDKESGSMTIVLEV